MTKTTIQRMAKNDPSSYHLFLAMRHVHCLPKPPREHRRKWPKHQLHLATWDWAELRGVVTRQEIVQLCRLDEIKYRSKS